MTRLALLSLLIGCCAGSQISTDPGHVAGQTFYTVSPRVEIRLKDPARSTDVLRELRKIPDSWLRIGNRYGVTVLFEGSITNQPEWVSKRFLIHPRTNTPWIVLAGVYSSRRRTAYVGVDSFPHGSGNLALHEWGHLVDEALGDNAESCDWIWVHSGAKDLHPYLEKYPDEFWAECFARYFGSAGSRTKLKAERREAFNHFRSLDKGLSDGTTE